MAKMLLKHFNAKAPKARLGYKKNGNIMLEINNGKMVEICQFNLFASPTDLSVFLKRLKPLHEI